MLGTQWEKLLKLQGWEFMWAFLHGVQKLTKAYTLTEKCWVHHNIICTSNYVIYRDAYFLWQETNVMSNTYSLRLSSLPVQCEILLKPICPACRTVRGMRTKFDPNGLSPQVTANVKKYSSYMSFYYTYGNRKIRIFDDSVIRKK